MYYFETFERKQNEAQKWVEGRRTESENDTKNDSILFTAFEMTKQKPREWGNKEVKL